MKYPLKYPVLTLIVLFFCATSTWARPLDSTTTTLDNGLKVVLLEEHKAPIVVFQIWYNVGSKDEVTGKTGLSHLLEHMMFKGTTQHGKGEFSRIVARKGGQENAFTGADYTAYFEKFASDRLELSLQLESDRMKNLLFDPKETELETKVVKEERRTRTDDDPTSAAYEELYAAAFKALPYHAPVIGWMTDLDEVTREDLLAHYHRYYVPNNATIVVVGDFESQNLLPKIKEYFGKIPQGEAHPNKKIVEPPQVGERRVIVRRKAHLPFMMAGYHVPNLTNDDSYPLAVLADILSNGKSSRMYQELIYKQQLALDAGADYQRVSKYPNLFAVYGTPQPGKDMALLEKEIYKQIDLLKTGLVSDEELQRVKNQMEAHFIFGQDSAFYRAMQIGELETMGIDHHYLEQFVEKIRSVSKEDIQRVAQKYLVEDNRTVSTLIPLVDKEADK